MLKSTSVAALMLLWNGAAQAQEQSLCFEPGTAIPAVAAFQAVREVAAAANVEPTWSRHVRLRGPSSSPIFIEAQLELAKAGVGIGRIEGIDDPSTPTGCVLVEVIKSDPPFLQLWHYPVIYFEQGSVSIPPMFLSRLRYVAVDYRPGGLKVCIDGHSDTLGNPEDNQTLGRADAVARELTRLGVRAEDISIRGFGESRLARATADEVSEPLNRRAVVDLFRNCPGSAH